MDIQVFADNRLAGRGHTYRCALGRSGIGAEKTEGDGLTPVGCFELRRVLYRPDRVANYGMTKPKTGLPVIPLSLNDGWCDEPKHPRYNQPITRPFDASHETLWRDDALYDIIVILGHNDDPPVPGLGSAIFLHIARPDYGPTEGCVALAASDLLEILAACEPGDRLCVTLDLHPSTG
jgi:L,D-peptidoglycan transpeptidase YkuD (ErfK/YbiS/YcfS/YnhG family)